MSILEENTLESKVITAVLVFMLSLTVFISGASFHIDVRYDSDQYTGDATMYYARAKKEFSEKNSIYTYVENGRAIFDYNAGYDKIFIVPNRELGREVHIKAVKLMFDFITLYSVEGDRLNEYVYSNREENTAVYENYMLTVRYTEQNPYPRLVFSPEFIDKIKKTEDNSVMYAVAASLIFTILFLILLNLLELFISKDLKLKGILKKYSARLIFGFFVFLLLFVSLRSFNGYVLAVDYETDLTGNNSTVYFDYDDNGFREINSKYTKIDSLTGRNVFFTVSEVEGLRIVPNRAADKRAKIKAVSLYNEGILIKTYTADELKQKYLNNSDDVLVEDGCIVVQTTSKQESLPILEFNKRFIDKLNSPSFLVVLLDIAKSAAYIAFAQLGVYLYLKGKRDKKKYLSKVKSGAVFFVFAVLTVFCAVIGIKALAYILMPLMVLAAMYVLGAEDRLKIRKTTIFAPVCTVLSSVLLFNANSGLFAAQEYFVFAFWCCILLGLSVLCYVYTMLRLNGYYTENAVGHVENIAGIFIKIFVATFIYEYVKVGMLMDYRSFAYITEMMLGDVMQLNLMLLFMLLCTFYGLIGKQLTNCIYAISYFIFLAGNIIKLEYHNTMLNPADFLEIKDMLAIAPTIMGKTLWYISIALIAVLAVLLIVNIKRLIKKLKFQPFLPCFFMAGMLLLIWGSSVVKGDYEGINVCDKPYIDEITAERTNGPVIYNIFKTIHIPDMIIKAPIDYSEQKVKELKAQFEKDAAKTDNVRPNVICILAESFMDLNAVEELELSDDIIPFTRSHGFINMISPRYGGYTAAVEYEMLTGMTLAFYPPSVIPYTAYYTDEERVIPSVPQTFKDNGYKTYAIHPNTANFYGRNKAYAMMGFEDYWAIEKFNGAEKVKNSFVKDDEVAKKVIQTIDNSDRPVFTFAITMESHATSDKRFDELNFDAGGEISDADYEDLMQEAEAFRDTDRMIEKLCNYIDSCDEPTIMYVFGDHLPPLSVFGNTSYVNDINNKFSTIALCHCNYKDVSLTDKITPNYIAAQMIEDSGVPHSSYFDYIYRLKDKIPILHRDFIEVDKDNNEDLKKYYMIQYDLMFGKQWFYQK